MSHYTRGCLMVSTFPEPSMHFLPLVSVLVPDVLLINPFSENLLCVVGERGAWFLTSKCALTKTGAIVNF